MNLRRCLLLCVLLLSPAAGGAGQGSVHLLIPAGPGSGSDATARAIGETLRESGLIERASYENVSGGGGARAMAKLIEGAARGDDTLMISSTPILVRSLQGVFPRDFRDITPVAAVLGEYGTFAVLADSPLHSMDDLLTAIRRDPRSVPMGGGSVRGNLDHIIAALTVQTAGIDPRKLIYLPYDGGGRAIAALLSGEAKVISTGIGEALEMQRAGKVRFLATTSAARLDATPDVPTLAELKIAVVFVNWRGVFAAPGLTNAVIEHHRSRLRAMVATPVWKDTLARYGWEALFVEGDAFGAFLNQQEQQLAGVMRALGMLK